MQHQHLKYQFVLPMTFKPQPAQVLQQHGAPGFTVKLLEEVVQDGPAQPACLG